MVSCLTFGGVDCGLWAPADQRCTARAFSSDLFPPCPRRKSGAWLALSILTRIVRCKLSSALGLGAAYDPVMQQWDPSKGLQQVGEGGHRQPTCVSSMTCATPSWCIGAAARDCSRRGAAGTPAMDWLGGTVRAVSRKATPAMGCYTSVAWQVRHDRYGVTAGHSGSLQLRHTWPVSSDVPLRIRSNDQL